MINVYGYPNTRSTRVTWTLEEVHADYKFIPINPRSEEIKMSEFLRINPFGKIPVLADGTLILTESVAICLYVAEKFPNYSLIPGNSVPESRSHFFQWLFFLISELEMHLWTATKHTNLLPQEKRVPSIVQSCHSDFMRACNILLTRLCDHEYLACEHFTIADIICVSILHWANHIGIEIDESLLEYMERLSKRPALTKARRIEMDSIKS